MRKSNTLVLATALSLALGAAHAQEPDAVATLRVDAGSILVSDGAEYVSGDTGTQLAAGQYVLVTEDSAAALVYAQDCTVEYTEPGTYLVEGDCDEPAAIVASDGPNTGALIAAGVGAAVLIGAAAGGSSSSSPPPPPPPPTSP